MLLTNVTYTRHMQMLLLLLFSSSLMLVLHAVGMYAHWYWMFWWFDLITHALGGFSVGLLLLFFLRRPRLLFLFLLAIPVVVGWEVFEVLTLRVDTSASQYPVDTLIDVSLGFLGAYVAALVYFSE